MKRIDKLLIGLLILSFCITTAGYLLYTILIPVQDFETLSRTEMIAAQKELAINYPLGNILFHGGLIVFVVCLIIFVLRIIYYKKICKSGF